jgi:cytidine deaminase
MFSYTVKDSRQVYEISDDIGQEMFRRARAAREQCCPVPQDGYAAVVLTEQGTLYEGVSYKSDTQTLTMHAEATALTHAAIHGETAVIAVTGPNCHICKQLLWEQSLRSGIDIVVIIEDNDTITKVPLSTMMIYPWPKSV